MAVLYPAVLAAITPYGIADFTVLGPPPGALVAVDQRQLVQDIGILGNPITTLPPDAPHWQLRLALPQDSPVPFEAALPLQLCRVGDVVTWIESHTRRDRVRVWDAQVLNRDSGGWVAGNAQQGDFFTLAMLFTCGTDPEEA